MSLKAQGGRIFQTEVSQSTVYSKIKNLVWDNNDRKKLLLVQHNLFLKTTENSNRHLPLNLGLNKSNRGRNFKLGLGSQHQSDVKHLSMHFTDMRRSIAKTLVRTKCTKCFPVLQAIH